MAINVKALIALTFFLAFFSFLFMIFYFLSYLLTSLGSLILFLVLFSFFTKQLIKSLIFPGSVWYWRRSIERNFSSILSHQLKIRISEFKSFLELSSSSPSSLSYCNLPMILSTLSKTITTLKALQHSSSLNSSQTIFLNLLGSLSQFSENVQLEFQDQTFSLSSWCRDLPCPIENCKVLYQNLQIPVQTFEKIERMLEDSEKLFMSLDYMRADILCTFKCEQIWVEMPDSTRIDW